LRKGGSVVHLPELLPDHASPSIHRRHFLCYPTKPIVENH
jgi:hypothetical protein